MIDKPNILVLGATGTTGGEVAKQLINKGITPRLLVRSTNKAKHFEGNAEIINGDYENEEDLAGALIGIEKLYLVSGLSLDSPTSEIRIIDAAKAAGVKHIVKLSVVTAENPHLILTRLHAETEKHLMNSGLDWTMLRPGNFHTNALIMWSQTISTENAFYQPAGNGRWASIDPADIGAVAVAALTATGHENKAYTLTGDKLLNADEYAEILSRVLGRQIKFIDIPLEVQKQGIIQYGVSEAYADAALEMMEAIKNNQWIDISHDASEILGRNLVSFEDWAIQNKRAFL